jgi:hypothetical protein
MTVPHNSATMPFNLNGTSVFRKMSHLLDQVAVCCGYRDEVTKQTT